MQNVTIQFVRGDTYGFTVGLKDNTTGDAIPFIDGDTVYMTVRNTTNDAIDIQKRVSEFIDGKAIFSFVPADTADLIYADRKYDVELRKADGSIYTIIEYSNFVLKKEVTLIAQ